jgi:membrane-bound lytic murein transglycosylase D
MIYMRKILVVVLGFMPLVVNANFRTKDSISMETDYNKNLDSLIVTSWTPQPSASEDIVNMVESSDSTPTVYDKPDSFYIERLKKIPSVIGLTYSDLIRKCIQIYTVRKRDKCEEILALKEYYFPIMEEVLDKYGLPLELKYLSVIESALNPRAVSRAGATGLWQFMYGTGRLYKLNVNSLIDERRDPVAATNAAAHFLKDLYNVYGDWFLVIAAYNCGPGNVNKAIRRSGGKNYWEVYNYLPRETRSYVPLYIAATYVMTYYKDHNLKPQSLDMLPYSDTVIVRENIHFQQIADVLNIPIDQIRNLNPEYRRDIIPGKYFTSSLRLPAKYAIKFIDLKDSIVRYKSNEFFASDFKIIYPSGKRGIISDGASTKGKKVYHKVTKGETLANIASLYGVQVSDLRYWNDISGNSVRAGRKLVVYESKKAAARSEVAASPKAASKEPEAKGDYVYYEVKTGDTLWKIASQYPGVSGDDLMKWNNISDEGKIKPGQTIKIRKIN